MKVLMVTSAYPSDDEQWRGTIISSLAEALVQKGVQVDLVVPHTTRLNPDSCLYHGVKVWRYHYFFPHSLESLSEGAGMYYQFQKHLLTKIQFPFLLLSEAIFLFHLAKRTKPDLIHSHWIIPHGVIGAVIHRLTGIPHIISVHGSDINLIKEISRFNFILNIISHNTQCFTSNSRFTCIKTQAITAFADAKMKVIPMGMGCKNFKKTLLLPKTDRTITRIKKILFVGRLIKWKGVDKLIEAYKMVLKAVPDSQIIIVGDGPEYQDLLNLSQQLEIQDSIQFKGQICDDELQVCYQEADLLVLPSYPVEGQTEGLGVVLLEAMTAGVPVIGSNTGGIPDIIKNGVNGLLISPGNPNELASAIITLLTDTVLANKFRNEGYKTIQTHFTWDVIAKRFIWLYQEEISNLKENEIK